MRDDVRAYIESLPPDRRAVIEAVRKIVLANLPDGYVEAFNWGMIAYEVPLELSGKTYNGKPLMYAAIGNQKNHIGLYLTAHYIIPGVQERLEMRFKAAGLKLDMGKSCLRFRKLEDLELDAVADSIASVTPRALVAASNAAPRKSK